MRFFTTIFILVTFVCTVAHSRSQPTALITPKSALVDKALKLQLDRDPTWLRLGHYHKRHTIWGGVYWQSDEVDSDFFVAPAGRENPKAELIATLRGFFNPQKRHLSHSRPAETVKCEFPARYFFLMSRLGERPHESDFSECADYVLFRDRVRARSVTVVFSSYYMGNPESVFGHTLMRLNQADPSPEHSELLDYGVNYAAQTTTANPFLYAWDGLFGGFRGEFASMHYYFKVREYNDFDSRDLWEYDLNLTPAEVAQIVRHVWELGFASFRYFYLTSNCSYQLLTALEAAAPRLQLTSQLPFWVIPADTIRAVYNTPGLVTKVRFRPSLLRQYQWRSALLNTNERSQLRRLTTEIRKHERHLARLQKYLPSVKDPNVMDAALDYIDARFGKKLFHKDATVSDLKQEFLVARSQLAIAQPLPKIPEANSAPHLGHGTFRWSIGRGASTLPSTHDGYTNLSVRFALHSEVDPTIGYPPRSDVEFMHIIGNIYDAQPHASASPRQNPDPEIEEVRLIEVQNLTPYNTDFPHWSWKFRVGGEQTHDTELCVRCFSGVTESAAGLTWVPDSISGLTVFVMFDGQLNVGEFLGGSASAQVGPLMGIRQEWSPRFVTEFEGLRFVELHSEDKILGSRFKFDTEYSPHHNFGLYVSGLWIDSPTAGGQAIEAGLRLFR